MVFASRTWKTFDSAVRGLAANAAGRTMSTLPAVCDSRALIAQPPSAGGDLRQGDDVLAPRDHDAARLFYRDGEHHRLAHRDLRVDGHHDLGLTRGNVEHTTVDRVALVLLLVEDPELVLRALRIVGGQAREAQVTLLRVVVPDDVPAHALRARIRRAAPVAAHGSAAREQLLAFLGRSRRRGRLHR